MLDATAAEELDDYDSPENEKNTNPQEAVRVLNDMVETIGIEPTTSWMPFKRSPRWATPPFVWQTYYTISIGNIQVIL